MVNLCIGLYLNNLSALKNPFGVQLELSVITILVEHFSYWVFFTLYKYFRVSLKKNIKIIDLSVSKAEIQNNLSILFLGEYNVFWLNGTDLEYSDHKNWVNYLEKYKGPHKIIFFTLNNKIANSSLNQISLPIEVNHEIAKDFYLIFYQANLNFRYFQPKKLALSDLFTLMSYQIILPKQIEDQETFFTEWSNSLLSPNRSLYLLSQYLFSKQTVNFFNYWDTIKNVYPNEFWTSYWSEQLYQAILFIENAKLNIISAKAQARKLPFSFLNFDHANFNIQYLAHRHADLYILDFNIKMGLTTENIEYWYHIFLNK